MIVGYKLIIFACVVFSLLIFACNHYSIAYADKIADKSNVEYQADMSNMLQKIENKIQVHLERKKDVNNGGVTFDEERQPSLRREGDVVTVNSLPSIGASSSTVHGVVDVPKIATSIDPALYPPSISFGDCITPSVLAVGGTDGSGTRRVVWLLTMLGVTMVSEDQQTYDIHADVVGGWPQIVTPLVKAMKSFNYDPEKLPANVKATVTNMVNILLDGLKRDSIKPPSRRLGHGGALVAPWGAHASRVTYGFKAPISMALFPLLPSLAPSVKLLHVLRDGRDIAFSANQGPVTKFYDDMYGRSRDRSEQKGIKLWSDWNTQIYDWAKSYALEHASSFGYHAVHIEDLVSDTLVVRYTAIHHLAHWVGSDLTEQELCCVALHETEFMGSHDGHTNHNGKSQKSNANYGKWKPKLAADPSLGSLLKKAGGHGLEVFGYEPMRTLAVANSNVNRDKSFQCVDSMKSNVCREVSARKSAVTPVQKAHAECVYKAGVDYKGGASDILTKASADDNGQDCCRQCYEMKECEHFTLLDKMCFLKRSKGTATNANSAGVISGDLILNG